MVERQKELYKLDKLKTSEIWVSCCYKSLKHYLDSWAPDNLWDFWVFPYVHLASSSNDVILSHASYISFYILFFSSVKIWKVYLQKKWKVNKQYGTQNPFLLGTFIWGWGPAWCTSWTRTCTQISMVNKLTYREMHANIPPFPYLGNHIIDIS